MPACNKPGSGVRQFTRRSFLQVSGAATIPFLVPGSSFGAQDRPTPSNRINIGFIGTGRQAIHANIPGFLHQPDCQVVAVCDVDSWRMRQAKEKVESFYGQRQPGSFYKGCVEHADWRELLARKDIDAVMISTPDHWHVPMCLAALKAGKHVSCEKPLTRSVAEGRRLAKLVMETGLTFCTDSEFRSERMCHKAAQLVRNGKIGQLRRIMTATPKDSTIAAQPEMPVPEGLDYDMWLGPAPMKPYTLQRVHPRQNAAGRPGWITIRDYADGMLANWGAHWNDIAMWANNTEQTGPIEIHATGKFPPEGNLWDVVQEFEAHFTYANGVELTCKTDKPYIRFEGTEGWIHLDYPMHIELEPESLLMWEPGPGNIKLPRMASEKRDFLDAIKARRQPQYSAEGGHRNASLSHLALASIQLGRKLKWDPGAEKVIGDEEANQLLQPKPARPPWDKLV